MTDYLFCTELLSGIALTRCRAAAYNFVPSLISQNVIVSQASAELPSTASIAALTNQALKELDAVSDSEGAEQWRVSYLGRRGQITGLLRSIPQLDPDQRREVGTQSNQAKNALEEALARRIRELAEAELAAAGALDVTLPGRPVVTGRLHPTTQIVREICSAFIAMGFSVVEGPEVELDHYNFEMLNIPAGHPARDMWNSLWVDYVNEEGQQPMLLRTHTSPMQARVMEAQDPPVRVIVPGKCYRYEATDATHEWHFYQIEGLAVAEGITFANLKGTLYEFARRVFGPDRQIRFRCDYFPFVEPGVDMSISNFVDPATGKRPINRDEDWIEIMGAGMVHPRVLEGVGYDPQRYTGFAFGMGPERIGMLKYGIDDIRHFYRNDVRFLRQF